MKFNKGCKIKELSAIGVAMKCFVFQELINPMDKIKIIDLFNNSQVPTITS